MSCFGLALLLVPGALPASAQVAPVLAVEPALARVADDLATALGGAAGRAPLALTRAPAVTNASQALRAVRNASAALALVPLASLQRASSLYAFDQIPFFTGASGEHTSLLIAAARPFVEKRLEEEDLALLALLPEPPVGLWLDQPDDTDLGRHQIAPQTAAERRVAELLALQIVDGPAVASAPRARFASFATRPEVSAGGPARVIHATRPLIALIANRTRHDAMAPDDRQALEAAARRLEMLGTPVSTAGGLPLPRVFVEAGERLAEEWAIATGADGHQILADYRQRLKP